jgi:PAS domain S-box-containing protein
MSVVPLKWPAGGAVISHTDITQSKQFERALTKSESEIRLIADALPVLVSYVDAEERYRFNNVLYERWFKIARDQIQGRTLEEILGEAAYETVKGWVHRALAGEEVHFEMQVPYPGGLPRDVEAAYIPHRDEAGRVLGFYALVQDITERKRAEREEQRHRDELARVARAATVGEFAASLAHELNQPLAAILCNAQAILHSVEAGRVALDELRETLNDIVQDDKRAGEVIRALRALLKKGDPERAPVDINGTVQEVVKLVRRDALERKISIILNLAPDRAWVLGDHIQLQQVLLNLVMNGFEAMLDVPEAGKELRVRTSVVDERVTISVQDQGVGIDPALVSRLFEPFFTTKPQGIGMGLSIARSIVEAHGGAIEVVPNPGPGATFTFTLSLLGEGWQAIR